MIEIGQPPADDLRLGIVHHFQKSLVAVRNQWPTLGNLGDDVHHRRLVKKLAIAHLGVAQSAGIGHIDQPAATAPLLIHGCDAELCRKLLAGGTQESDINIQGGLCARQLCCHVRQAFVHGRRHPRFIGRRLADHLELRAADHAAETLVGIDHAPVQVGYHDAILCGIFDGLLERIVGGQRVDALAHARRVRHDQRRAEKRGVALVQRRVRADKHRRVRRCRYVHGQGEHGQRGRRRRRRRFGFARRQTAFLPAIQGGTVAIAARDLGVEVGANLGQRSCLQRGTAGNEEFARTVVPRTQRQHRLTQHRRQDTVENLQHSRMIAHLAIACGKILNHRQALRVEHDRLVLGRGLPALRIKY